MTQSEIEAIDAAIARAEAKHPGTADMPNGTGDRFYAARAMLAKATCNNSVRGGIPSFALVFDEECAEVLAETDPARIDAELLDVIAVAMRWRRKLAREMEA